MDTRASSVRLAAALADAVAGGRLRSVGFKVAPSGKTGRALVAETALQQARGLRGVDLGVHDAMLFANPADHVTSMTMHGMDRDLEIAWLDETGQHLGNYLMRQHDEQVLPPGPYRHAMEFEVGGLAKLGVTDGSRVLFDDQGGNPGISLPRADTLGPGHVDPNLNLIPHDPGAESRRH